MRHVPNLDQFQRLVRTRVCAECPLRTAGTAHFTPDEARPCESRCALFRQLPVLLETSVRLDPLVGGRRRVMAAMIGRIAARNPGRSELLLRQGKCVTSALDEILF